MTQDMAVWGAAAVGLIALGWVLFGANRRRFDWTAPTEAASQEVNGVARSTVIIDGENADRIEGWLYLPKVARPPVIIMAPGLAGTKEGPLERLAQHFGEQGFAVLLIDFRTFGGSAGLPRHNTDPRLQVEDYVSTIAHVRGALGDQVDVDRIVLWGTSFSGAAAACAATTAKPSAVILHVPYTGKPAHPPGALQMAGYVGLVMAEQIGDALARLVGVKLPPVYITAYGQPGERAFGASAQCPSRRNGGSTHPFWRTLPAQYRGGWRNLMAVRALAHLSDTDPEAAIRNAQQPTLIIGASKDDMIAIGDLQALAAEAPSCVETQSLDAGHFDPYVDPLFGPNMAMQVAFLRRHVG